MKESANNNNSLQGFTLVELSIVLVIIGLIISAVLVGHNLIASSSVRAQISEIQSYQSAINTFKTKYGYLPGDIPEPHASGFGFTARGTNQGQGDGNGLIETYVSWAGLQGYYNGTGETAVFWRDLSKANLISANFNIALSNSFLFGGTVTLSTTPSIADFMPSAKIGQGSYIYTYSENGKNYLGLSAVYQLGSGILVNYNVSLTPNQAWEIDSKIDDGNPARGRIIARYLQYTTPTLASYANPDTATTCYNHTLRSYSTMINGGNNITCALSFEIY